MSNNVGEMLVGRVGFGESAQARSASYSAEDAMAVTIVRLYQEGDELRAEVAMLRDQARILAGERDEARHTASALNRRLTKAEGIIKAAHLVENRPTKGGGGLGRALANYSADKYMRERDEARDMVLRLRKQRAIARNFGEQMERERDEARVQFRSTEALAMALVKTIDELKAEKSDLFVKLVNLQAGSRRATLDEIAESVREKYDERHEAEEIEN